jgi:hypothetical protein
MKENSNENWERDFQEFLASPSTEPPSTATQRVLSVVRQELNPASWKVFIKLLIATSIGGAFSLAICPQFGFGGPSWFMHFFMQYGDRFCSIACGAIFLTIGTLMASFFLRPEELRVVRRTRFLQFTLLALISLSAFVCAGVEFVFGIALFWILGAIAGSLLVFEVGYRIRFSELYVGSV